MPTRVDLLGTWYNWRLGIANYSVLRTIQGCVVRKISGGNFAAYFRVAAVAAWRQQLLSLQPVPGLPTHHNTFPGTWSTAKPSCQKIVHAVHQPPTASQGDSARTCLARGNSLDLEQQQVYSHSSSMRAGEVCHVSRTLY